MAAFPLSVGALTRMEVLAASKNTNAVESMNKLTQMEVKQQGSPTLLGAIQALMAFDASVMAEVMPSGQAFSVGGTSDRAKLLRSLKRRQKNSIPAGSAPPKSKSASTKRQDRVPLAGMTAGMDAGRRLAISAAAAARADASAATPAAAVAERVAADASAQAAVNAAAVASATAPPGHTMKPQGSASPSHGAQAAPSPIPLYAPGSQPPYVGWESPGLGRGHL